MFQVVVVGVVTISLGFVGCLRLMSVLEKHQRRSQERRQEVERQREEFWRSV
jgi:hypothetical protein